MYSRSFLLYHSFIYSWGFLLYICNKRFINDSLKNLRFSIISPFYSYSSPASDLAARRGVFSRRHYGSVELVRNTTITLTSASCLYKPIKLDIYSVRNSVANCSWVVFIAAIYRWIEINI